METKSKYMKFDKVGDTGKTEIWNVTNKLSGFLLGQIRWCGPWRQYAFMPSPNGVFNNGCMTDIQNAIKELMGKR